SVPARLNARANPVTASPNPPLLAKGYASDVTIKLLIRAMTAPMRVSFCSRETGPNSGPAPFTQTACPMLPPVLRRSARLVAGVQARVGALAAAVALDQGWLGTASGSGAGCAARSRDTRTRR